MEITRSSSGCSQTYQNETKRAVITTLIALVALSYLTMALLNHFNVCCDLNHVWKWSLLAIGCALAIVAITLSFSFFKSKDIKPQEVKKKGVVDEALDKKYGISELLKEIDPEEMYFRAQDVEKSFWQIATRKANDLLARHKPSMTITIQNKDPVSYTITDSSNNHQIKGYASLRHPKWYEDAQLNFTMFLPKETLQDFLVKICCQLEKSS